MSKAKEKSHPKQSKQSKQRRLPGWLKAILLYVASLVLVLGVIAGAFSAMYNGKVYPRVTVAGVVVGGLKPEHAKVKLHNELEKRSLRPAILTDNKGHSFTIKPEDTEASFDIDKSVTSAMAIGRDQDKWLKSLGQKITAPLLGHDLSAALKINDQKFDEQLRKVTDTLNVAEKNADLKITNGIVSITPPVTGKSVETKGLKEDVLAAFGAPNSEPVELKIKDKEPEVKAAAAEDAKKVAEVVLAQPIQYLYEGQTFEAKAATIGRWLKTKPVTGLLNTRLDIEFNEAAIDEYLNELGSKIDQEPQEARVAMINGALNITQSSKDGLKMKRDTAKADTLKLLTIRKEVPEAALVSTVPATTPSPSPTTSPTTVVAPTASPELKENQVRLSVEVKKPEVTDENIHSLGIKERIAISETDFRGSPHNRAENIRLGTRLFNGIILSPGEQFSAVKSLGRIDESAGFKKDLVIKEDQLVSEVGGGLCQVSTTLFRAALNAGLDIDERRNHSFRVSYYEAMPPNPDPEDYVTRAAKTLVGMDATIYDPNPDFKFTNDTGNYVLVQGKVEGTRLTFELFGTKDGRTVTIEGPFIDSSTPAPTEVQYIDDPNLPSGQLVQKEKAVGGTKTHFNYRVEKDGKELHKQTFRSNYTAWKAKFYRGTGPVPSPSPSPVASPVVTPAP